MNGTGGGGGARRTTTVRVVTTACGWRTGTISGCASTLRRPGATCAVVPTTVACSIRSRGTTMRLCPTGRDSTNVCCDTTVTAPGAARFRSWMFVTFTVVTLMFVSVTFVTLP